eukprot:gb/GECG01008787.1/.p1 GENE.gb/GECG01008787.1/~~gb/GECG01008787.1/.p1  ORF type:complete len:685 (+),score=106.24 gb/GECG01008787.1/:1-2055(+)
MMAAPVQPGAERQQHAYGGQQENLNQGQNGSDSTLTRHAVPLILQQEKPYDGQAPLKLQILDIRKLSTPQSSQAQTQERYRSLISDGEWCTPAMLASPINQLIHEGKLTTHDVIAVDDFTVQKIQSHRVVVVLKCSLVTRLGDKIGEPVPFTPEKQREFEAQRESEKENFQQSSATYNRGKPFQQQNTNTSSNVEQQHASSVKYESKGYSGPIARASDHKIHPVAALNPFLQNWMIKVRVTNKSDVRHWKNAKGEGSLFSCDLLDEHGTEIRATFFKDAVDKFFEVIQEGKVYIMGGGRLKAANRRFTSIKNEYEITFDTRATIEACQDDDKIENEHFDFVSIGELEKMSTEGTIVDVIGVAKDVGEVATISTKGGNEVDKRDLSLVDRSGSQIQVTLWGEHAQTNTDQLEKAVVALKGVRLTDFNTRSLSTNRSSKVEVNPDINEAHQIRGWYDAGGASAETKVLTQRGGTSGGSGAITNVELRKTLSAIDDEGLGMDHEKADVIITKATVTQIFANPESPPWYPADPTLLADGRKSRKKLVYDAARDQYISEITKGPVEQPDWVYVLRVAISDPTGSKIVTLFNEDAEQLVGKPASEMRQILEETQNEERNTSDGFAPKNTKFSSIFKDRTFTTWYLTLRIKNEMVKDEQRLKVTVARMRDVDPVYEGKALISGINKYPLVA